MNQRNSRDKIFENSIFDRLFKVAEVAERLSVSSLTIRDWVYKGKIPYVKIGKALRFDMAAIQKWIAEENNGN